jgi:hypothetical protein
MECNEIFLLLTEYLNFDLPPEACEEMNVHIEGCLPCVEFVESLKRTIELCRRYQPGEVPGRLSEAARSELEMAYKKTLHARRQQD